MSNITFLPSKREPGAFEVSTVLFVLTVRPNDTDADKWDAEVEYLARKGRPIKVGTRPNQRLAEGAAILCAYDIAERETRRLSWPRIPCQKCGRAEATKLDKTDDPKLCQRARASESTLAQATADCEAAERQARDAATEPLP